MQFRSDVANKIARCESDANMAQNTNGQLRDKIKSIDSSLRECQATLLSSQQAAKKESQRLTSEKTELEKQNTNFQQKEKYYQHEAKKKEIEISRLQEMFRKQHVEADSNSKAGIEITQLLRRKDEGKRRSRWKDEEGSSFSEETYRAFEHREKELINRIKDLEAATNLDLRDRETGDR
eukprot:Platyproteum_vivax@DN9735_c0_g1_i1.p1